MIFKNFESDSYCVGSRQQPRTVKIYGDLTSKRSKVLID